MSAPNHAVAVAANIALARQVYDIPEDPITHDPIDINPARFAAPENYRLPAQKELELAHALAITSKLKDESDYTSAVAIVEDPKRRGIQVLLAVNRATVEDGLQELEMSRTALENVLEIMKAVRNHHNEGMEERILSAVVTACMPKILARMGLAPCRHNKTRMPLDGKLNQAVQAVNALLWQRQPPGAQEFRMYGANVLQLIAHWRQAPDDVERLVGVVQGLYRLNSAVPNLDRLMRELPPRSIVPSAAKSIAAVVSKTAYYVRVARTLYRIAKKYPIVRRGIVVPVILSDSAFAQTSMPHPGTISRDQKIRSLCSGAPPATLQAIVRSLNSSSKAARAGESFEEIMHTSLTGRIHAEMQIIYHCTQPEMTNSYMLPRAVCASKASCFLCNAFVSAHMGVYVPFSHGRLYTNWRLPNMGGLEIPEAAFVGRLENAVTWGLGLLSAYGHAPQRPEPAQSVVMDLARSLTTLDDGRYEDNEGEDVENYAPENEAESTGYGQEYFDEEHQEYAKQVDKVVDVDEPQLLNAEHEDDEEEYGAHGSAQYNFQEGVPISPDDHYHSQSISSPNGQAEESGDIETAPTTPEPEHDDVAVSIKDLDDKSRDFKVEEETPVPIEPKVVSTPAPALIVISAKKEESKEQEPIAEAEPKVTTPVSQVKKEAAMPIVIPAKEVAEVPLPVPTPPISSAVPYAVEQATRSKVPETVEEAIAEEEPEVHVLEAKKVEKKAKEQEVKAAVEPVAVAVAAAIHEPAEVSEVKKAEEEEVKGEIKKEAKAVEEPVKSVVETLAIAVEEPVEAAKVLIIETPAVTEKPVEVTTAASVETPKEAVVCPSTPAIVMDASPALATTITTAVAAIAPALSTPTKSATLLPVTLAKTTAATPTTPVKAVSTVPVIPQRVISPAQESVASSVAGDGASKKKSRIKSFFKSLKGKKEKK